MASSFTKKKRFWVLSAFSKPHLMTSVSVVVSAVLGVWLKKLSTQIWQNICGCTKAKLIGIFRNTRRHLVLIVRRAVLLSMGHLPIGCFADDKKFGIVPHSFKNLFWSHPISFCSPLTLRSKFHH